MKHSEKEPLRNRPAEEGRNEDPNLRDRSGQQPGVPTMSSSQSDKENDDLTETAADNFASDFGKEADKEFDDLSEKGE